MVILNSMPMHLSFLATCNHLGIDTCDLNEYDLVVNPPKSPFSKGGKGYLDVLTWSTM